MFGVTTCSISCWRYVLSHSFRVRRRANRILQKICRIEVNGARTTWRRRGLICRRSDLFEVQESGRNGFEGSIEVRKGAGGEQRVRLMGLGNRFQTECWRVRECLQAGILESQRRTRAKYLEFVHNLFDLRECLNVVSSCRTGSGGCSNLRQLSL